MATGETPASPTSRGPSLWSRLNARYQKFLDDLVPYRGGRWGFCICTLLVYIIRIYFLQGWYIVTYALAIYLLSLFIAFLSPKFDPAVEEDTDEDGPSLPTTSNEEFKPFIRRLPEFKFWHSMTRAILIAFICTFFSILNIPVFWPILLIYFIVLFAVTMKKQIMHMIKYKYLPFTHGKRRYQSKDDTSSSSL
ncbi:PREDICTED: protein RER1-like isoform X2 [Amphimedon queenslandica]|uniref:Protein RER1 n=1 Tax=Amphimedon queenslandica TaxID=400682 RepID=A0AAN0IMV8_AMPQE|nr:PREDICTED: protein RER1-like isoform X2 [Amphimedon queenslandica]|eukprot:XP_011405045.1 PREDICTED: protein RER1-like isoform X2 [Amphimedon queenslandica]